MARARKVAATGAVLAVVAGASFWAVNGRAANDQDAVTKVITGTAAVQRTDIAERRELNGTLGYVGTSNLIATGPGTLTRLPATSTVIGRGDTAYEVDGVPVVLFYGARPIWRDFSLGMTDGTDVQQLESNLRNLGYATNVTVDKHFSSATYWAVRHWQKARHLTVTGTVPLGQIVYAPGAVRIEGYDVKVGEQVQPGALVEHGSSQARAVTTQLDPADLPTLRVGERATVTLPDGSTKSGRVSAVGAVAQAPSTGSGGSGGGGGGGGGDNVATVPVTITVQGKIRGFVDQAQVQVGITQDSSKGVLAVPITALRGVVGGGYEVIVVTGGTSRHVPVQTGLFDETAGLAEVRGSGLAEGQKVEVPLEGA